MKDLSRHLRHAAMRSKGARRGLLALLLMLSSLGLSIVVGSQAALAASGADNFNRANGSLGAGWTATSDGAMVIAGNVAQGGSSGNTGEIRTGETYSSNHFSQIQVASQPSGGQWIAAGVRLQNGGQNGYAGLYFANYGNPELMLFKRTNGAWSQLGSAYASGTLATGTQLTLSAAGPSLTFSLNGAAAISVTDSTFTGGAPGILAFGTTTADNWAGGDVSGGSFSVGGTVSGLSGTVVLQDNGGDNLSVSANGAFTFATLVAGGAAYRATVLTNPAGQTCTVTNGSGTIGTANVTNVAVACTTKYSVGGTVSGLSGTVVLQDNGGDNLSVSANGAFTFATQVAGGAAYKATVLTNPAGQTCTVTNGSGTIGTANVTNVAVTCTTNVYSVGGTVSGLSGPVVLQDNGGDNLSVSANGSFTFATSLVTGATYKVTVLTNPAGQTCTVATGSGTIKTANITNVAVTCNTSATYSVGGTVSGLSGTVVLQDNSGDNLSVSANGSFTFATSLVTGATYKVTVLTNPAGQTCTVTSGSGTIKTANITSVAVACKASATYSVGGTLSGLSGTVVLQDNGGDNLNKAANGSFTFATRLASGATYNVTVLTNPAGQTCTVSKGSGTIGTANVTSVAVACTTNATTYSVGGTASGLSGTAVLQDNGGDNLNVSANGSFTFATKLSSGAAYTVTVVTNPAGQTCSVTSGTGTVGSANITNVAVTCTTGSGGSGSNVSATDDFNRADGSLGPNWTAMSDGAMVISSDTVVGGNSGNTGDIRTAEIYGSDQYSQIQVTTAPTGGQWIAVAVRAQNSGQNTYLGLYYGNNGTPVLEMFKRVGGAWSQLGPTYPSGVIAAGTQLSLSAVGSNITLSENGSAVITASDTTLTGGAPAIMAYGTTSADNWAGGTISVSAYSVSGTVSGLSGSVVLQDNGGDNLIVSANGSFTFATPLATGATYFVTVLTNPAGQTCSVSNASGTMSTANVTNVAVSCTAGSGGSGGSGPPVSATDDFNRANSSSLGPNWTATSDGSMVISGSTVAGGSSGSTGDIRTAETYPSGQFSQIQITSTPTGAQWIGVAVRAQSGGQNAYVGVYSGNSGSPELILFERSGGAWSQFGTYASGVLPAGTVLRITAVGNTIALLENNVVVVSASDASLTGGAPAIMASGPATADNWAAGNAGFEVDYQGTDPTGIQSYSMISANNGYGVQTLRVLKPTHPKAGVPHNFLYVLPVEADGGTVFGDGLAVLQAMDAQDQYNLTIVEPTFSTESWYANDPLDPNIQYEAFMAGELAPWVTANLASSGTEQNWLIGFSKSGIGGQDLILKHPGVFTIAASWDFPADLDSWDGTPPAPNYGTEANYQANYQLTSTFVNQYSAPFKTANRIWIGGYSLYQQDLSDYDAILKAAGVVHSYGPNQSAAHAWTSGWVPTAMAALYQDSLALPGG